MRVRARIAAAVAGGIALTTTFIGAGIAQAASDSAFPQYLLSFSSPGQSYLGINSRGDILGNGALPNTNVAAAFVLPAGSSTPQWLTESHGGDTNEQRGAVSLNDHGQAAGGTTVEGERALFWPGGNTVGTDLGINRGGAALAKSINNNGQIVGGSWLDSSSTKSTPWLYQNGQLTNLPTLVGNGIANAVNDNGVVVGAADTTDGSQVAVSWENGKITQLGFLPGGTSSIATAVNRNGVAVGLSTVHGSLYPTIFDHGTATRINVLGDQDFGCLPAASSINDSGAVVGTDGDGMAFAYQNGVAKEVTDLLPANAKLYAYEATGINDAGVIVGNGIEYTDHGQVYVGYKLTPVNAGS